MSALLLAAAITTMPMTASWYEYGETTASMAPFDPDAMTAAHRTLPFGTLLRVTNPDNGQAVIVEINDRGPYCYECLPELRPHAVRDLDLSRGAFAALEDLSVGVREFEVEIIQYGPVGPACEVVSDAS